MNEASTYDRAISHVPTAHRATIRQAVIDFITTTEANPDDELTRRQAMRRLVAATEDAISQAMLDDIICRVEVRRRHPSTHQTSISDDWQDKPNQNHRQAC